MKKLLCMLLVFLLACVPALAEVSSVPEGTEFLSPRETAQEIIDVLNMDFAEAEGAFSFDRVVSELDTECCFMSDATGAQCVMEYDETNMGVSRVIFLSFSVDDAYMCASMAYHIVELFYGGNPELVQWFNTGFMEAFEGFEAQGYGQAVYPMDYMDVIVEIAEVEGEYVFVVALECDYFLAIY